ncbi:Arrestin-C domain-containing protein [Aphelenchoides bicaudatus]|nr:Arrestin-C domain-containing protein [Aphelenchoides bicaudatus]
MQNFQINLDNPLNVYNPGQTVSGHLQLRSNKSLKARNIKIEVLGVSKAFWSESRTSVDGQGRTIIHTIHLSSEHKLLDEKIVVWERENKERFPEGDSLFPFKFHIPEGLPPTFKSQNGNISYRLEARIDVPWWFDKTASMSFEVAPFCDLNLISDSDDSQEKEEHKSYGFFVDEKVGIKVHLDKKAYAIGEKIKCIVEANNHPNRFVKQIETSLVRTVECLAQGARRREYRNLVMLKDHLFDQVDTTAFNIKEVLQVPETCPSVKTANLSVSYNVKVNFRINGKLWDNHPDILLPVTIGTIPIGPGSIESCL